MSQAQAQTIAQLFPLNGTSLTNKFTFREDKKTKTKRPEVSVVIPVPTAAQVSAILAKEQENNEELANIRDLLMSAINGVVITATKSIVDDNTQFESDDIAKYLNEVSLHTIANAPKAQRGGITNAALQAFASFLQEVGEARLQISATAAGNLATIFGDRKTFASHIADDNTRQVLAVRLEAFGAAMEDAEMAEHNVALTYLVTSIEELSKPKFDVNEL